MSVYFTSDLHLGHRAIHEYRKDRFSSQEEHDEYILNLIDSLNKRDVLIVLGDFIFDSLRYDYYISRLKKAKCRIKVVMGNHDSLKLYKEICLEIQLPLFSYKNMWLSHAPIHDTELRNRLGNVHGHLHKHSTDGRCRIADSRYFNVNIDVNDYEFVSLDDIKYYYSCRHKPINSETLSLDDDVIMTIDYNNDLSIDIVSIDKHLYQEYSDTLRGFEAYIFRRDGIDDYEPIDVHWDYLPSEKELLQYDFSDYIDERLNKTYTERELDRNVKEVVDEATREFINYS